MLTFLLLACSGSDSASNTNSDVNPAVQSGVQEQSAAQPNQKSTPGPSNQNPPSGDVPVSAKGVTFAGTVSYAGSQTGSIELEILDNSSGVPMLMGRQTLKEFGAFSIDVTSESNELMLMAYLDLTGNQISDDDPRGYLKITNARQTAEGLDVVILDLKDLENSKDDTAKGKDKSTDKKPEDKAVEKSAE